jgi:hypothetical protein
MRPAGQQPGLHDFAFQTGSWIVTHRKLAGRLVGSTDWLEFDGTCQAWEVLDGAGNVDDFVFNDPNGRYCAATFRRLDRATGEWAIHWADGRREGLDPPLRGRFDRGTGLFFGTDHLDGRSILVRFIWSDITPDRARWEQAFSPDNGTTWETNWVMTFRRAGHASTST